MRGLWPSLVMNDKTKRTMRGVGNNQGSNFSNGKSGNAPHLRSRRKPMAVGKSKEAKPHSTKAQTLADLLRSIRCLGICRLTKIGNSAWQIDSSEEGRASCLLVIDRRISGKERRGDEGRSSWTQSSQKERSRGGNRTGTIRGASQNNNANKRSSRNIYEIFGTNSSTIGCAPGQFSNQSQS